ncbi:hypothetical protein HF295_06705 [Hujiaoplasma nucleasis]|uniref:Uncharacterized protein n=1 Tax=Hujiaoplasma nucleasis TaxID=2725268 RepID=A0A7L6N310_9MOLU|nr:hypothetical protein [Hujiaoplasma nucleasis]QLY40553.1 hypothetical protein HF295_06705 [Hujiaoplasma nucleasis]
MPNNNLYKGKFIISIYDKYDNLVTVLDNAREFAFLFDKSFNTATSLLSKLFHKKILSFYHHKTMLKAFFIEDKDYS